MPQECFSCLALLLCSLFFETVYLIDHGVGLVSNPHGLGDTSGHTCVFHMSARDLNTCLILRQQAFLPDYLWK